MACAGPFHPCGSRTRWPSAPSPRRCGGVNTDGGGRADVHQVLGGFRGSSSGEEYFAACHAWPLMAMGYASVRQNKVPRCMSPQMEMVAVRPVVGQVSSGG